MVEITTISEGNLINFSFDESTAVTIDVMNMLGQSIIGARSVNAGYSSEKVTLPTDFQGMYLIRITSAKGTMVQKFYRD
jgi:type IX secretion system substrate protein